MKFRISAICWDVYANFKTSLYSGLVAKHFEVLYFLRNWAKCKTLRYRHETDTAEIINISDLVQLITYPCRGQVWLYGNGFCLWNIQVKEIIKNTFKLTKKQLGVFWRILLGHDHLYKSIKYYIFYKVFHYWGEKKGVNNIIHSRHEDSCQSNIWIGLESTG